MTEGQIRHKGKVVAVVGSHVQVEILQTMACASCSAHRLCPSAEGKERQIDITDDNASDYAVGQEVSVCGSVSMARKATRLAFGVPLVLTLVWTPFAIIGLHLSEIAAVGGLLLIYIIYFSVLHLRRNALGSEFTFRIEKTISTET